MLQNCWRLDLGDVMLILIDTKMCLSSMYSNHKQIKSDSNSVKRIYIYTLYYRFFPTNYIPEKVLALSSSTWRVSSSVRSQ